MVTTQISSKYSLQNNGLFELKRKLTAAGFAVSFPAGDKILEYVEEFAITTLEEKITPFPQTQTAFMKEVERNPIHIIYNVREELEGYLGESAAIEVAYALCLGKPIIKIRENIIFGERVPIEIRKIVQANLANIPTLELDRVDIDSVKGIIDGYMTQERSYVLDTKDKATVASFATALNKKYENAWKAYQRR